MLSQILPQMMPVTTSLINYLLIDIETYSSVDLSKCGVFKYSESSDFKVLLFGYSINGEEVQVVDLASGEPIPPFVISALKDDNVMKYAYNASFERACLSRYLGLSKDEFLNPVSWKCHMVWSAYLGLPLSLKGVAKVLNLDSQKMEEGKELIKYFCVPNKEGKQNTPDVAPSKWELFKKYNKRDVEVELQIHERLIKYPVPDFVWDEYHMDQEINDRGILVDSKLVDAAIDINEEVTNKLNLEMKALTGIDNPNSVLQLKEWFSSNGVDIDTLGKKDVLKLKDEMKDNKILRVLSIRQQISKSSIKKYQAMQNAKGSDDRARGMFMFYGANRTGRWAGRLIQLQNLPQNHLPDLEDARELVISKDINALEMLYEDIPDTLSQLIRTAFIPIPGYKFIVADFSAIEARVIAWFANEKWRIDAFKNNEDIYCASASQMFHKPVVKHGINGELRQKGKVAELACIAEGQLVLTNRGLVPIEKVTNKDLVWDGIDWVAHDGVVYKGVKDIYEYEGLRATADHQVYVEGYSGTVSFEYAIKHGLYIVKTGFGGKAIRLGENHIADCFSARKESASQNGHCSLRRVPNNKMDKFRKHKTREQQRLSKMFSTTPSSDLAIQAFISCKVKMRKSKKSRVQELRTKGDQIQFCVCNGSRSLSDRKVWNSKQRNGIRQSQYKRSLRKRKSKICYEARKQSKSKNYNPVKFQPEVLALFEVSGDSLFVNGLKQRPNNRKGKYRCEREKKILAFNRGKTRLYDIRNAGPNHRYTVSNYLVHNCGYGGSVGALKAMGAEELGLTDLELKKIVSDWRNASPNIVNFWWAVDKAAKDAIADRKKTYTHGLTFECAHGMLFVTLPSGRKLSYVKPKIIENQYGGESISYEGIGTQKKWERLETYGPKIVENIVQGTARDVLCNSIKTLRNYRIVGHVHDELIIEVPMDETVENICNLMAKTPSWCSDLVLRADGYECQFYKKD